MMVVFTHFFACAWHFITKLEIVDNSWLYHGGQQDESYARQYLFALYWSLATVSTIAYGDISSKSDSNLPSFLIMRS